MSASGTDFEIADPAAAWARIAPRLARTRSDAAALIEARRRCEELDALCLAGPDGIVILSLKLLQDDTIALKVLLAVGTCFGAFKRQESAMCRIAAELGASVIVFETDRRGWGRLLGSEWHQEPDGFSRSV